MNHSGYFRVNKPGNIYIVWFDTTTKTGATEPYRQFSSRTDLVAFFALPEIGDLERHFGRALDELERTSQAQFIPKEVCLTDEELEKLKLVTDLS